MAEENKKEKIIGIDLGTSNSAASVLIGGKPTVIPSAEGTSRQLSKTTNHNHITLLVKGLSTFCWTTLFFFV